MKKGFLSTSDMEGWQIQDCLDSMTILCDTREQPSERAEKRYKAFLCPYRREKLDYGDYTAVFTLNGSEIKIKAAIERKMNLEELSSCLTHDRDRFRREFERASADNASVYLLVEDASWEALINGRYKTRFNPRAFFASLTAWIARYNLKPIFCKKEMSGALIHQILYRELKERLERGDYG